MLQSVSDIMMKISNIRHAIEFLVYYLAVFVLSNITNQSEG